MKLEVVYILNFEGPWTFFKSLWPARVTRKNRPRAKAADTQLRIPFTEDAHDGNRPGPAEVKN